MAELSIIPRLDNTRFCHFASALRSESVKGIFKGHAYHKLPKT